MEWVGVDNQLAESAYKKAKEMLQSFSLAFSTAALSPWLLGHVYTIAPAMQQWPPLLVKLLILTIYAYAAAAYSLFVLRWARPGWARFMLSAPVVAAHLSAPLLLDHVSEPLIITPLAGCFSLSAFKLLAFALDRGPLTMEGLTQLQWLGVLLLPIVPLEAYFAPARTRPPPRHTAANVHTCLAHGSVQGREGHGDGDATEAVSSEGVSAGGGGSKREAVERRLLHESARCHGPKSLRQVAYNYATNAGTALLVSWVLVVPGMPVMVRHWLYTLASASFLTAVFDVLGAWAWLVLGINAAPSFDKPWLCASFQDFWARRWNLVTTYMMRVLVYEPVTQGCLLPPYASPPPAAAQQQQQQGACADAYEDTSHSVTTNGTGPAVAGVNVIEDADADVGGDDDVDDAAVSDSEGNTAPRPTHSQQSADHVPITDYGHATGSAIQAAAQRTVPSAQPVPDPRVSLNSDTKEIVDLISEEDTRDASDEQDNDFHANSDADADADVEEDAEGEEQDWQKEHGGAADADVYRSMAPEGSAGDGRMRAGSDEHGPQRSHGMGPVSAAAGSIKTALAAVKTLSQGRGVSAEGLRQRKQAVSGRAASQGRAVTGAAAGAANADPRVSERDEELDSAVVHGKVKGAVKSGVTAGRKQHVSQLRRFLALQATFAFSGAWHILVFWYNTRVFSWRWCAFFAIQATILMVERMVKRAAKAVGLKLPHALQVVLANFLLIVVARTLFFGPADDAGFAQRNLQVGQDMLWWLMDRWEAALEWQGNMYMRSHKLGAS